MSSCHSTPDDLQKDPDYTESTDSDASSSADHPAKVNVSTFLRGRLKFLAPELARSSAGSESEARKFTLYNRDLYELGLLPQPLVLTRNKVEYEIMRDGKERIEALSEVDMQGDFLIRHKLGTKVLIDDYFFQFELFLVVQSCKF